jgi:thiamine-monophosphate kinase
MTGGHGSGPDVGPRLGPGREFDRIRGFLDGMTPARGVRVGPGDDAAVLDDGTVLSTDLAMEGIHFRLDWITPREAGWRAGAAALSDLAAMAADPVGMLVSLAVPPPGSLADEVMAGIRDLGEATGVPLLGGDLTRSVGPVVLDVVVVGRAAEPLLRSGARSGDELWVTGPLGAAAAAIEAWEEGRQPSPAERAAFAAPRPRLDEARWLARTLGATAGLDLSDGLAGDAGHLSAASGVGVELVGAAVLQTAWRGEARADTGADADASPSPEPALLRALHGGEDFELLVALPPGAGAGGVEEFRRRFDLVLSPVGRVVPGSGVRLRPVDGGAPIALDRGGWDHFAPGPGDPASP